VIRPFHTPGVVPERSERTKAIGLPSPRLYNTGIGNRRPHVVLVKKGRRTEGYQLEENYFQSSRPPENSSIW